MVAVFSIFGTLTFLPLKQMGVGLAAAILIDATIIRAVPLPASMKLLGDANWYLPSWLQWLPQVKHQGMAGQPAAPAAHPVGALTGRWTTLGHICLNGPDAQALQQAL